MSRRGSPSGGPFLFASGLSCSYTSLMTKRHKIIIDMDGIVADFMGELWDRLEARTGLVGDTAAITDFWRIEEGLSEPLPPGMSIRDIFCEPGFFRGLAPIPGALEGIRELEALGHEPVICTAPATPLSAAEKMEWLARYLPDIPYFIGAAKHHLAPGASVLIDDANHNAEAFLRANPGALTATLAWPYNGPEGADAHGPFKLRGHCWRDPQRGWEQLVTYTNHYCNMLDWVEEGEPEE